MPNHENLQAVGTIIIVWAALFFGFLAIPQYVPSPLNLYVAIMITVGAFTFSAVYFGYMRRVRATRSPIEIAEPMRNPTVEVQDTKHLFKMHMVTIPVGNKPDVLDENARNVQVGMVFRSGPRPEDLVSVTLPWLDAEVKPPFKIDRDVDSTNPTDVVAAMSKYLNYEKIEMQRGVGYYVVAFFGLESTQKAYIANKDPFDIGQPEPNKWPALPFQLRVSGDNFRVFRSQGYFAVVAAWDQIGIASGARTIGVLTPKGFRVPLGLRIRRYLHV